MTAFTMDGTPAAGASSAIPAIRGPILALTDDGTDPRFGPVLDVAARLAAGAGSTAILFYEGRCEGRGRPSHGRVFDPLAGALEPGAVARRSHTGTRRRDLLRDEARWMSALGADVLVWLAGLSGARGLNEAILATGATAVLAPAEPATTGGGRAVRLTLRYRASRILAPLFAVERDGRLVPVRPLGAASPAILSAPTTLRPAG